VGAVPEQDDTMPKNSSAARREQIRIKMAANSVSYTRAALLVDLESGRVRPGPSPLQHGGLVAATLRTGRKAAKANTLPNAQNGHIVRTPGSPPSSLTWPSPAPGWRICRLAHARCWSPWAATSATNMGLSAIAMVGAWWRQRLEADGNSLAAKSSGQMV
jgi:hypothetical protein